MPNDKNHNAKIYLIADQTSRSVETIEQTIEERPWTSLLGAFGAGVIVAKLLSRGR